MIDIEKVLVLVLIIAVGWFLVGWSIGYKAGIKDGYQRGRAAGLRAAFNTAKEIVKNS